MEKPAARLWPPPPWARAITDTSTSSSVARSETLRWPRALPAHDLADEHRDLRAPQRAQVVDDALGVAFLGPGAAEVLGVERGPAQLAVVVALDPRERERQQDQLAVRHRPRTGGGRRRARPRPASISSAAIWCARGVVFSYMNRPVSVISPTYSASAISGVGDNASACIRSHTISAVHEASGTTWLIVPKRVLSWWWSMFSRCAPSRSTLGRVAVDVAAVEEHDRPRRDVRRAAR